MTNYSSVHVNELVKITEIKDALGNLRYKVSMIGEHINDDHYGTIYTVQVVNYFTAPEPLIILTNPKKDEPPITDYCYILKFYNECVKNYTNLVKAETRDFQDIDIYKDKIDYQLTYHKCCGTCKWCRERPSPKNDFIIGVSKKLECTNPLNSPEFDYMLNNDCHSHNHYDHHKPKPRHYSHPKHERTLIYPTVELFGICKNYEVRKEPYKPFPGDSLIDIVDRRCGDIYKLTAEDMANISTDLMSEISAEFGTTFVEEISANIANTLSSNIGETLTDSIIQEVGEQIEHQLAVNPPIIDGNDDDPILVVTYVGGGAN